MNRRTFLGVTVQLGASAIALAADKGNKQDRLSGVVNSLDADKKVIEMHARKSTAQVRKIMYDGSTSFTLDGKPAKAEDAKQGLRIVAVGKFEGVNLQATQVALYNR